MELWWYRHKELKYSSRELDLLILFYHWCTRQLAVNQLCFIITKT